MSSPVKPRSDSSSTVELVRVLAALKRLSLDSNQWVSNEEKTPPLTLATNFAAITVPCRPSRTSNKAGLRRDVITADAVKTENHAQLADHEFILLAKGYRVDALEIISIVVGGGFANASRYRTARYDGRYYARHYSVFRIANAGHVGVFVIHRNRHKMVDIDSGRVDPVRV